MENQVKVAPLNGGDIAGAPTPKANHEKQRAVENPSRNFRPEESDQGSNSIERINAGPTLSRHERRRSIPDASVDASPDEVRPSSKHDQRPATFDQQGDSFVTTSESVLVAKAMVDAAHERGRSLLQIAGSTSFKAELRRHAAKLDLEIFDYEQKARQVSLSGQVLEPGSNTVRAEIHPQKTQSRLETQTPDNQMAAINAREKAAESAIRIHVERTNLTLAEQETVMNRVQQNIAKSVARGGASHAHVYGHPETFQPHKTNNDKELER